MREVLVFGHTSPDTDPICSAIAYARLKNATDPRCRYVPVWAPGVVSRNRQVAARIGAEAGRRP